MTSTGSSVLSVARPSPASRAGLKKGDIILECNGSPVRDWLDVMAGSAPGSFSMTIKRGLSNRILKLRRRPGEALGLELADSGPRQCGNRCIFCFVDQQPNGLRRSLLIKDDDVRYSFMDGTYVTLTDGQTEEAVERGFNTLHVSVHTTDPELRGRMLGRPGPMPVLRNIDRLAEAGIDVQAQVVVVPGWNDGEELERTADELYRRNNVRILGIVPVGLTRHRKGLEPLRRPDSREAADLLSMTENLRKRALMDRGTPWIYPADEYYLLAGADIPPMEYYRDCTLHANGIGLLAGEREACSGRTFKGGGTVVTGELAAPFLKRLLAGSNYLMAVVTNHLMGSEVGVAGLLGGMDIVRGLARSPEVPGTVFIPSVLLNHQGLTLDGLTVEDISRLIGREVEAVTSIGELP